jgi:hypothetical protein
MWWIGEGIAKQLTNFQQRFPVWYRAFLNKQQEETGCIPVIAYSVYMLSSPGWGASQ